MRKTRIYRVLVVFFLLAILFGSSAAFSIETTEIMLAVALVMALVLAGIMLIRARFPRKSKVR
jgi:hypothetical protein